MADRKTIRFKSEDDVKYLEDIARKHGYTSFNDFVESTLKEKADQLEKGIRMPTSVEVREGKAAPDTPISPPVRSKGRTYYKEDAFMIPVGNVIMKDTCPTSKLWWCPPERIDNVKAQAQVFIENGFTFHVGEEGNGTFYEPEVIEQESQRRGHGMPYSPSGKLIPALIGDKMVWLEIQDVEKAYNILQKRSDVPCAIRCDVIKYSYDNRYKEVFDIANDYFIHYWLYNKPKKLNVATDKYDVLDVDV